MEEPMTTLAEVGAGPVTVELDDGSEHEVEFDEVEVNGTGIRAEGTDNSGAQYRIEREPHAEESLALERRSPPDSDWAELGEVAFVEQGH